MKNFIAIFALLAAIVLLPSTTQAQIHKTKSAPSQSAKTAAASPDDDAPSFYDRHKYDTVEKKVAEKDTLLRANTDTLMKHIRILSSSQYEGRMAGSQAYMDAAAYCADVLASYGLKPLDGEWNQYFQVEYNEIENCTFNTFVNDNDTRTRYVLGRDFVCSSMTGSGYTNAPVVFCGWGIDNRMFDEYAQVDARGKIVLVISGVPDFLPTRVTSQYATLRDKAETALRHGAVGLVCIHVSENCRPNEVQHQAYCGTGSHQAAFPVVQPTQEMGDSLLAHEQMSLDSVINVLNNTRRPQSFHLRKNFEININAHYLPKATTCNVVGVLPGYDSRMKREVIVVGAHLDHVGIQGKTCIFPGADDNASGVAAVLEAARLLTTNAPENIDFNKRTILFVLFSGAEVQHLGSSIFVSNYPQLKNVECFINAECVGAGDSINIQGQKLYPNLWKVACHNDSISTKRLLHSEHSAPKGDAAAFSQIGIPSLVFTHYQGNHHPHVPSDISENIEREILTLNASLMAETIYELSLGDYQGRSNRSKRFKIEQ